MYFYIFVMFVFFFKQKTAYDMRISDWSSDVCSPDLIAVRSVIEFDALRFRIEKWEDLWIVQKQVDVVTFTMIDLQHQCGSAAEAPLRREAVRSEERRVG